MRFEFATATRIIFGPGTVGEIAPLSAGMGKHACVVTGSTAERTQSLLERLDEQGVEFVTFSVAEEPTTVLAKAGVELARRQRCDLVLS
ncbi:MAG: iron-containing alcohol dehydrogenase, partial [Planctomycetota bacterium]